MLRYLDSWIPQPRRTSRARRTALDPLAEDPAAYGRAVVTGRFESCEEEVVKVLVDLLDRRLEYGCQGRGALPRWRAERQVVANAERYYRAMYRGNVESWNLRDQHMFDTLNALLDSTVPTPARWSGHTTPIW